MLGSARFKRVERVSGVLEDVPSDVEEAKEEKANFDVAEDPFRNIFS